MRPCAAICIAALLASSCAQLPQEGQTFEQWRMANEAEVSAFESHLDRAGLLGVFPMNQLLRSATSWQTCRESPYAVPPSEQWPAVASVLRLIGELRATGAIGQIEMHSGYRNKALNLCAGGATRSAHLLSFAIDFTASSSEDPTARLCEFWRTKGRAWNMGLSRYPSGRIHIDTAGFRTWGSDHTGASAVCGAA